MKPFHEKGLNAVAPGEGLLKRFQTPQEGALQDPKVVSVGSLSLRLDTSCRFRIGEGVPEKS